MRRLSSYKKTVLCFGFIENDFTDSETVCFGDIWLIFCFLKQHHEQHFYSSLVILMFLPIDILGAFALNLTINGSLFNDVVVVTLPDIKDLVNCMNQLSFQKLQPCFR